jgi:hypothetical protein
MLLTCLTVMASACGPANGERTTTETPALESTPGTATRDAGTRTPVSTPVGTVATPPPLTAPLVIGDPVDLPRDLALVLEENDCAQCDGYTQGLRRVYRDPSGHLRSDLLAGREESGAPLQGSLVSFALNPDGSRIVASACLSGGCGALDYPTKDAITALYTSADGGVSWHRMTALGGRPWPIALVGDQAVVETELSSAVPPIYTLYPDGTAVTAVTPRHEFSPRALTFDELGWIDASGTRLLAEDGAVLFASPADERIETWLPSRDRADAGAVVVTGPASYPFDHRYLHVHHDTSAPVTVTFDGWFTVGGWVGDELVATVAGSAEPRRPPETGVIDLATHVFHPFTDTAQLYGFEYVRSVQIGPFARVVSPGDCLNIRAAPGSDAPILTCATDGSLLHDRRATTDDGTTTWAHVDLPGGRDGWASAQYLER